MECLLLEFIILKKKNYIWLGILPVKNLYIIIKKNKDFAFASEAKAFHKNFSLSKNNDKRFFNSFQHCLNKTLWKEVLV